MTNINNTLAVAKSDGHIAGVTWSLAGNCILLVCEGHAVMDLKPLAGSIAHLCKGNPNSLGEQFSLKI
jgi:hypothetical protein